MGVRGSVRVCGTHWDSVWLLGVVMGQLRGFVPEGLSECQ